MRAPKYGIKPADFSLQPFSYTHVMAQCGNYGSQFKVIR